MNNKLFYLRYALIIIGFLFVFGIVTLMHIWPSGWKWLPNQYQYEQMILGIYATLGVFLIRAAKEPLANLSLIWFTVWSSIVHATIMLFQALYDPLQVHHIYGDVLALYLIAIVLAILTPRRAIDKL